MRFRVQNIRKGYCEVWANERDGQRYKRMAEVRRLDNGGWHWLATDYYILPEENYVAQGTRHDCICDCKKTALKRLVRHAIERQPRESQHWHSPRRDAWHDVKSHSYLFAMHGELEEIKKRLTTFEEE
jgi:hypothetical protein